LGVADTLAPSIIVIDQVPAGSVNSQQNSYSSGWTRWVQRALDEKFAVGGDGAVLLERNQSTSPSIRLCIRWQVADRKAQAVCGGCYALVMPAFSFSITWLIVKLAGRCEGGNSTNDWAIWAT